MFLVKDRRLGVEQYVFTNTDPRQDGYKGEVLEGVTLEYPIETIHLWEDGQDRPDPRLGRNLNNSNRYKVFKFHKELQSEGYELVHSAAPIVTFSWPDYRKQYYPVPEAYAKTMTSDEWFDFLEETDLAAKLRKKMTQPDTLQSDSSAVQIAEWVAKRHIGSDGAIQQVWFLPDGSPADEIRLLEVSDRFTGDATMVEPIDFGLDVSGAKYKLLVADISTEQLDKIKGYPAKNLPNGWKFEGAKAWGRRGPIQ